MHRITHNFSAVLLPIAVFGLATVGVCISLLDLRLGALRLLTGLVLVVFAPSYALLLALDVNAAGSPRRLLLSLPLSLALTVLVGVAASVMGLNLAEPAPLAGMWLTVAIALGVYEMQAASGGGESAPEPQVVSTPRPTAPAPHHSGWALMATVAALALSVGWAGNQIVSASYPNVTPYTSLAFEMDGPGQPTLVIENHERGDATYRLEVFADGTLVQRWENVQLAQGAERVFALPTTYTRLEALLYRDEEVGPYRTVWLQRPESVQ